MATIGGRSIGGDIHWYRLGVGVRRRGYFDSLFRQRTSEKLDLAIWLFWQGFWATIWGTCIFVIILLVGMYFYWGWTHSVLLWLSDTIYGVLQSWGL